ncbi:MAG: site-specific integrase [Oscillibacter sp.]|nr:site-specific integrase [Oscillibacter sp.]
MSNHYRNLLDQAAKLHRHNRQGSYKTRARFYEAMLRFCRFLAEVYRLERLANIGPKHIYAYVTHLQESGKSASTIKTELSAIRFSMISFPMPSMNCRRTGIWTWSAGPSVMLTGPRTRPSSSGCGHRRLNSAGRTMLRSCI